MTSALCGSGLSTRTAIQRHCGINNSNNKNDIEKKILRLLDSDSDVNIFIMVINCDHERKFVNVGRGNEIEVPRVTVSGEYDDDDDDMCHDCDNQQRTVNELCSCPEHKPGQPKVGSSNNSEPNYWYYYDTFVLPAINLFSSIVPAVVPLQRPGPELPGQQQPSPQHPAQQSAEEEELEEIAYAHMASVVSTPPRKTVIRFNEFLPTKKRPRQSRPTSVASLHCRANTSHATKAHGRISKPSNGRVNKTARNR